MKFQCCKCGKRLCFFQLYGRVLRPFTHYCKICWAKQDIEIIKMDLEDAKRYLENLQCLEKFDKNKGE